VLSYLNQRENPFGLSGIIKHPEWSKPCRDQLEHRVSDMTQTLPLDVRFLKRFTRRLHRAGVPAHQLEGMVGAIADWLGYACEIWSTQTAVIMTLRHEHDDEDNQNVPMQLMRLQPASTNLADMTELYGMADELISGRLELEAAFEKLSRSNTRAHHPSWVRVLAGGLVSGSFAVLLVSSWQGAIVATFAGLLVGLLYAHGSHALRAGGMEAIAAIFVSLFVYYSSHFLSGVQEASVIMSGLIVLIPGLALTIAVTELSTDHLSAGSARLAGAMIVLLKLSLGVLIGTVVAKWLGWDIPGSYSLGAEKLPDWMQWPALILAGLSFAVIFNVRVRDFYLAVLAAVTGFVVSRLGVMAGGVEFGVLLAALAIALLGNSMGRFLRKPAALIRLPGIILLVPGALGYRTVTNVLVQGDPSSQETTALVTTMLIALVGGLLIGNTIVPPRRYL
jgi:uncharacterized membrane protein YjjP (DUF1212 family)